MVLTRIISMIIGYLIGCINFAYIIGRFHDHIDIRNYGSGNSGTTNAIRVMGWKLGALTFLGDFLKSIVAYFLTALIFESSIVGIYAGFGVVVGHNWPVFLKFKGGKGIASTLGLIYAVDYRAGLIMTLIMFLIIYATKYVSVGSLIMAVSMPILFYYFKAYNLEFLIVGIILMIIAIFRHLANIKRLLKGTENKLGSKKV
jgi:acyl phosphate:glycerol-3-phosphate acyltransferase